MIATKNGLAFLSDGLLKSLNCISEQGSLTSRLLGYSDKMLPGNLLKEKRKAKIQQLKEILFYFILFFFRVLLYFKEFQNHVLLVPPKIVKIKKTKKYTIIWDKTPYHCVKLELHRIKDLKDLLRVQFQALCRPMSFVLFCFLFCLAFFYPKFYIEMKKRKLD